MPIVDVLLFRESSLYRRERYELDKLHPTIRVRYAEPLGVATTLDINSRMLYWYELFTAETRPCPNCACVVYSSSNYQTRSDWLHRIEKEINSDHPIYRPVLGDIAF